tara:strand:+ start:80 stop:430 length:351 start_codon:yes stop_codon:yes gene_type:complete
MTERQITVKEGDTLAAMISGMEERLEKLEEQKEVVKDLKRELSTLRLELKSMVIEAAHDLRDDSDFSVPYWKAGADHVADHWWGKLSRRGMVVVLGACAAALLIWLGTLGIVLKKP